MHIMGSPSFPLVSVAMSVYKEPIGYIDEALHSILEQTYENLEFLIVLDDPGNLEARSYLESQSAADGRIRLIVNDRNMGLARSLNRALEAARGDVIARMDADDIAKPERIEHELHALGERSLDAVACGVDKIDGDGSKWGEVNAFSERPENVARLLPVQNVIVHPTVLFRKEAVAAVGGYRNFASCQDYDLWLRLLTSGKRIGLLDERLLCFRRHPGSVSATRRYGQIVNESYIRQLYRERLVKGSDSFSEERLQNYQAAQGVFDVRRSARENDLLRQYSEGVKNIKGGRSLQGVAEVIGSLRGEGVRAGVATSLKARWYRRDCEVRDR